MHGEHMVNLHKDAFYIKMEWTFTLPPLVLKYVVFTADHFFFSYHFVAIVVVTTQAVCFPIKSVGCTNISRAINVKVAVARGHWRTESLDKDIHGHSTLQCSL